MSINQLDEWIKEVSQWQDQAAHIPIQIREEIAKGRFSKPLDMPEHGPQSFFVDPLTTQYALGYKDRRHSLTYDTLKAIPHKLSIISAILQTRTNQIATFSVPYRTSKSVGFTIKHKDPTHLTTKSEMKFIRELETFMVQCGHADQNPHSKHKRDNFETFLKKVVRDSLTYDQLCFEIVPDRRGLPYEFMAVDAATIRLASDDLGFDNKDYQPRPNALQLNWAAGPYATMRSTRRPDNKTIKCVQLINGQPVNYYSENELAFGVRNPRTDIYTQGYGFGELEQLVTIITSHLHAETHNSKFFTSGCVAGDTLVYTNSGIVRIDSLVGESFRVWNGVEFVDADAVASGAKRAIRTKLQNDQEIVTSPDHKFLTFDSEGNTRMVPISELRPGDYVAQADELVEFDPLPPVEVPYCFTAGKEALATGLLDAEFYEFIGFLVGDGFISKTLRNKSLSKNRSHYNTQCVFGPKDHEVKDKFLAMLRSRGFSVREGKSGGQWGGTPIDFLTIRNKGLFEFLRDVVGVSTEKSHLKGVPTRLFKESVEHRAAFLRGLFSSDGFIKNGYQAHFCSSSRVLVDGVQHLLWSLGIHATLSHVLKNTSGRNCYYLRVSNNKKFDEVVGFLQGYKKQNPSKSDSKGKVPVALQEVLFERLYGKTKPPHRWLTRADLQRFAAKKNLDIEALKYRWIEIESITDTKVDIPTYDIRQMDSRHQWSAGSCIVSNSSPKGILNFRGDSMDSKQLEGFKRQWQAQMESSANSWRTPILQSEAGLDWIDLHRSNRDMEFGAWLDYLIKISAAVFLIDPAELNFEGTGGVQQTPLFESSQEWKLKASRDRGLKPLLRFIANLLNEHIIEKIDDHFYLTFDGMDELSEQEKHTLRSEQVSSYKTLNEVRREDDLGDLDFGDIPMNPVYLQAMQIKFTQDQAKQQQEADANLASVDGEDTAGDVDGEVSSEDSDTPEYSDSVGKSLVLPSNGRFLEIDLDSLDAWKSSHIDD